MVKKYIGSSLQCGMQRVGALHFPTWLHTLTGPLSVCLGLGAARRHSEAILHRIVPLYSIRGNLNAADACAAIAESQVKSCGAKTSNWW